MDLVDKYLFNEHGIILEQFGQKDKKEDIESASPEKPKQSAYKFTEHTSKENEAKILDNPVYQKMQFYPFRH